MARRGPAGRGRRRDTVGAGLEFTGSSIARRVHYFSGRARSRHTRPAPPPAAGGARCRPAARGPRSSCKPRPPPGTDEAPSAWSTRRSRSPRRALARRLLEVVKATIIEAAPPPRSAPRGSRRSATSPSAGSTVRPPARPRPRPHRRRRRRGAIVDQVADLLRHASRRCDADVFARAFAWLAQPARFLALMQGPATT